MLYRLLQSDLATVVLADLAAVHGFKDASELFNKVQWIYAHSWYHEPFSRGAFALFGPGQFNDLYGGLIQPAAGGRLHIAGEAASCHHAWIAGAFDSASRAVNEIQLSLGGDAAAPDDRSYPADVDKDILRWQIFLSEQRFKKAMSAKAGGGKA